MTTEQQGAPGCAWSQDGEDSDTWQTDCGGLFSIIDGKPSENNMRFCCYCGKSMTEHPHEEEIDE